MTAYVKRQCRGGMVCMRGIHTWEMMNPQTDQMFRRGRVVFVCNGRGKHAVASDNT